MITILSVGKIKDKHNRALADEYLKRLQPYHKVIITEVKDYTTSSKDEIMAETLEKEADNLLKVIKDNDYVILLAIKGLEFDSVTFSDKLDSIFTYESSNIVFVIGGSMGVSQRVIDRANLKWSFSQLTFPHQLFRVMVLEQIYRSFRIKRNEPYHK